jgi:hypothetical protein
MVWTEQSLAQHFFSAAEARAARDGRHFGEGADRDLRNLTFQGAHNLLATTPPDRLEHEIGLATSRIVALIEMALIEASTIDGYDPSLLGERTYFPARIRFCPCTPFC